MLTLVYLVLYLLYQIISNKKDFSINAGFVFFLALDFYIIYYLNTYKELHEAYGPRGPGVIRTINDPLLGPTNITEYPFDKTGWMYSLIVDLSIVQHSVLQNLLLIGMAIGLYIYAKSALETIDKQIKKTDQ